jgi:hypothetical protein
MSTSDNLVETLRKYSKEQLLVRIVLDAKIVDPYVQYEVGILRHVGDDYVSIERKSTSDEKNSHDSKILTVEVPIGKILKVIVIGADK